MKFDVELIKEFLEDNLGEIKMLGVWVEEINGLLPKNRRMTRRELAYVFNRIIKNQMLEVNYYSDPIQYSFKPLTSSSQQLCTLQNF